MKILKNFKVIVALILALAAIGVLIGYCSRVPSSELTRPQMLQLLDDKLITRAAITPMIYQGFYGVEGTYLPKLGAKPKAFTITLRLPKELLRAGWTVRSEIKTETVTSVFPPGALIKLLFPEDRARGCARVLQHVECRRVHRLSAGSELPSGAGGVGATSSATGSRRQQRGREGFLEV